MKRANGQGSIRYDRERKRYEMRVTIDGHRRKVVGKTQADVIDRADLLRRNAALGPGLPAEMTVTRFLAHWTTDVLPLSDLSPTTATGYATVVRLYIIPTIGKVRLDQLAPVPRPRDAHPAPRARAVAEHATTRPLRASPRTPHRRG